MNRVQLKKFLVEKYETYNSSFFRPVKDLFWSDFRQFMTTLLQIIDQRTEEVNASHIATRVALNSKGESSAFAPYQLTYVDNRRLFKELWSELSTRITKKNSESWAKYFAEIKRDARKYDFDLKKEDPARAPALYDSTFFYCTRFSDEAISRSRRATPGTLNQPKLLKVKMIVKVITPEDEAVSKSI